MSHLVLKVRQCVCLNRYWVACLTNRLLFWLLENKWFSIIQLHMSYHLSYLLFSVIIRRHENLIGGFLKEVEGFCFANNQFSLFFRSFQLRSEAEIIQLELLVLLNLRFEHVLCLLRFLALFTNTLG